MCLCSIVCFLSLGRYQKQLQSFTEVSELRKPMHRPKLKMEGQASSADLGVLSIRHNVTQATSSSSKIPKAITASPDASKAKAQIESRKENHAVIPTPVSRETIQQSNLNALPVHPISNSAGPHINATHPLQQASVPSKPSAKLTESDASAVSNSRVTNSTSRPFNASHPRPQASLPSKSLQKPKESAINSISQAASPSSNTSTVVAPAKPNQSAQPQPLDWSLVKDIDVPTTPFVRYEKVVVATKLHSQDWLGQLMQMLCLFHAAYNRHVNYDIVVFTTLPWDDSTMQQVQAVVPHTKLIFQVEGPPLHEQIAALTPEARAQLMRRCNVSEGGNITWEHMCDHGSWVPQTRLNYAWQAEFRSYLIWTMPVLAPYKYMLWMDTDALCTKPWPRDPLQLMVERDLVLMFDNFPGGRTKNPQILLKMYQSYGRSICQMGLSDRGRFQTSDECKGEFRLPQVHGFHHITNLDFYRNETNLRFLKSFVEPHRFSREWDDQMAVTLPAAVQAPKRVADYRLNGLNVSIFHNFEMDGKELMPHVNKGYVSYWQNVARDNWESGRMMCDKFIKHTGR